MDDQEFRQRDSRCGSVDAERAPKVAIGGMGALDNQLGRRHRPVTALASVIIVAATGMWPALGAYAQAVDGGSGGSGVQAVADAPQKSPTLLSALDTQASTVATIQTAQIAPTTQANDVSPIASPTGDVATGGNVAELQRRIAAKELSELRTVYNGSYGASLLMANSEPTYYIALFERKNFWRVIKTPNDARAEAVFADFSRQTVALATPELRTLKLEAQKRAADQLIAINKDRTLQIQADLAVQQTQGQAVAQHQQQALAQVSALDGENRQAQLELADLRRQIDALQKQADVGLPPTTPARRR